MSYNLFIYRKLYLTCYPLFLYWRAQVLNINIRKLIISKSKCLFIYSLVHNYKSFVYRNMKNIRFKLWLLVKYYNNCLYIRKINIINIKRFRRFFIFLFVYNHKRIITNFYFLDNFLLVLENLNMFCIEQT